MMGDEILERIARVDPVPTTVSLDPANSRRAVELKGKIMATDPESNIATEAEPRRVRRWIAIGAAAAGIVALVVAVTRPGDDVEPIVFSSAQSGPSGRNESAATADATMPNGKMAAVPYEVQYEIEGDLPALDDKAQSWKSKGAPSTTKMNDIAKALGVDAEVVERKKADGGGFVAGPTDGSGPSVSFGDRSNDPFGSWWYSTAWGTSARSSEAVDPAVTSDTAVKSDPAAPDEMPKPENLPTKNEARDKVMTIMSEIGIEVRDNDVEVYADDWSVSVTVWQRVGDLRAPMSWTFGFGDNAQITWAGGNLLTFEKGPKFPRVGASAGVDRLGDPKFSGWYGYGGVASRTATEPAIAIDESGAATKDATVQTVVITGVKESLTPIVDADNVVWLVPSYEYTVKDGYTVSVLAITDEFIEQAVPTVDTAVDGTAVEPVPATDVGGASGSSGSSEGSEGSSSDVRALSDEEAAKLVGLAEGDATKVAESNGWIVRVSSRDGEKFQLTMDFVPNRVNLAIVDGKVTGVSVG